MVVYVVIPYKAFVVVIISQDGYCILKTEGVSVILTGRIDCVNEHYFCTVQIHKCPYSHNQYCH